MSIDVSKIEPEHIPFDGPGRDSAAVHMTCAAMGTIAPRYGKTMKDFPHLEKGGVEVVFLINGVQVPFAETIEEVYKRFDDDIAKRAAKLLEEKVGDLVGPLHETVNRVCDELQKRFELKMGD
jgi:hypothetical protein